MDKVAFLSLDVEDLRDSLCFDGGKNKDGLPSAMDGARAFLSLCEEEGVKATLFVLASRLKEDLPFLKEAVSLGYEIGIHGYEHVLPTSYPLEEFLALAGKAKKMAEEALGVEVKGYRAPGWSLSEEEHSSLPSLGFSYSSSLCFTKEWASFSPAPKLEGYEEIAPNLFRKEGFYEFALPTVLRGPFSRLALGGGVVPRFFPEREVSSYIKEHAKKGSPFVLNAHPFELSSYSWKDRHDLGVLDNLYLGKGRKNWGKRLKAYIGILKKNGYRFLTFQEFLKEKELSE